MHILKNLFYFLLFINFSVAAQKLNKADQVIIKNLQTHIGYLSGDKLEGRRIGTPGETLAREYIKNQFQKNGLLPKGDSGSFFQTFKVLEGKMYDKKSFLFINDEKIGADEFFPLTSSPQISMEASPSIALKESGEPWFLDIKEDLQAVKNNPHFDILPFLTEKAKSAQKKGATALFIYNSEKVDSEQQYDAKRKMDPADIPVIVITNKIAQKYFVDETAGLKIKFNIEFTDSIRTGSNVIAYIDNGASTTAILGAHFDHLGYGEDGNSLLNSGERMIHHGADDNASGIAALIELSKLLKKARIKANNYLFIAFSGEELGLFGSKYFIKNPTIDLSAANYMINMDMVGRLDDQTKTLIIGGYGTSPSWSQIIKNVKTSKNIKNRYDSSGAGPSDHTSFYTNKIPVLFFFTGIHKDYHKPTDDSVKVNYIGEYYIVQYIYKIIESANKSGKLAFNQTRDQQMTASSFSVTLGIMPDYTFNGSGVRVDGISDGRPAQKAGLQTGDVVIQLGEFTVTSMENYMQALNKFKKGDITTVKVKRAGETVEASISF
ncbi:MAG: M20/M25/M40 family metallo-hydrolase [Chitinophagaceae bacterium]